MAKTRKQYNAYMKVYMLRRYHEHMARLREDLGGKCVKCGSSEDLEIDHIDRTKKKLNVAKVWSHNKEKYAAELRKCQLLCKECHRKKTLVDLGKFDARIIHGTVSSVRYCSCSSCKYGKSIWYKDRGLYQIYKKKLIKEYTKKISA